MSIINKAKQLTGLNPLSYMGVESGPAQAVVPLVAYTTDPTVNDWQNFNIGTIWMNPNNEKVWFLVSLAGNQATWVEFTAGAGSVLGLKADDGNTAFPAAGIINIHNSDGNIATTAAVANTVTINFKPNITVTGSGATITLSSSTTSTATNPTIVFGSQNNIISFYKNNIILGSSAGNNTGSGVFNIAIGPQAMQSYTTGAQNTATGNAALQVLTTGTANCAYGYVAGSLLTTGNQNTLIGDGAGTNYASSESNNICLGYNTNGTVGESNITRIGSIITTTAFIGGQVVASGSVTASGDSGGIATTTTLSNANSTTISTGVGSVKMSSANPATNSAWIKIYIGTTAYWIPAWTTNSP